MARLFRRIFKPRTLESVDAAPELAVSQVAAGHDAAPLLNAGAEWLSRDDRSVASSCSEYFDLFSLLKSLSFLALDKKKKPNIPICTIPMHSKQFT
jgi:hypothetical protein